VLLLQLLPFRLLLPLLPQRLPKLSNHSHPIHNMFCAPTGHGHSAVVKLLVRRGVDTAARDRTGGTALHAVAGLWQVGIREFASSQQRSRRKFSESAALAGGHGGNAAGHHRG
jgi:hypothetical protein